MVLGLPNDDDWQKLEENIGMLSNQIGKYDWHGTYLGNLLTVTGNNCTNFSVLPTGYDFREYNTYNNLTTYFHDSGISANFWSSTLVGILPVLLGFGYRGVSRFVTDRNYGYSIRCVKN